MNYRETDEYFSGENQLKARDRVVHAWWGRQEMGGSEQIGEICLGLEVTYSHIVSVPFIQLIEGDSIIQDGLNTLVFRDKLGVKMGLWVV